MFYFVAQVHEKGFYSPYYGNDLDFKSLTISMAPKGSIKAWRANLM